MPYPAIGIDGGQVARAAGRDDAVKDAVLGLLNWLVAGRDLIRVEGYMLSSMMRNPKMICMILD